MADAITTKNITSVDEVQSVDNTDKVFVNDNGSFKQISVSNLMKQAPSGVTEETDPTVSEWAKQPTKPSYTADEVGALPVGTKIPTKTSDLTNDSGYLTQIPEEYVTETELGQKGYVIEDDIPEKLPSPGTLTFTGAVNDTYDGSANKTINIPTGGGEGGTSDYNALANKPKLNGVEIVGNKTSADYKIVSSEQGAENNGKFLGVGADGNVIPVSKPSYTATEVGADASGTAVAKVSEHNTAINAHSDIRLLVQGLTDRLNTLADSDDDTLDQMSEIVAYIKSNKTLIDAITTQKVSVADIVDNLTTNVTNKPLSAAQGVALKALIDGIVIPETLPNPQKLKFTGAVTAEYDGSTEQIVNIPESTGGDSYTLPIMSDTQLGGGKAVEKTDEDVPVAVDPLTGQLFVPTYPENTGGGGGTEQNGIPSGGTTGQVLAKKTDSDYDVGWKDENIISDEQVENAVNQYFTDNPEVVTNIPDGSVTEEKLSNDLLVQLGLPKNIKYTEEKIQIYQVPYNSFYNGSNSGSGTGASSGLFRAPVAIKITNNTGASINFYNGFRYSDKDIFEENKFTDFISVRGYYFNSETIANGETKTFRLDEYGTEDDYKYMQIRWQASKFQDSWNLIEATAIYSDIMPEYKYPDEQSSILYDFPMNWKFMTTTKTVKGFLYCIVPYYPNFKYYLKGVHALGTLDRIDGKVFMFYDDLPETIKMDNVTGNYNVYDNVQNARKYEGIDLTNGEISFNLYGPKWISFATNAYHQILISDTDEQELEKKLNDFLYPNVEYSAEWNYQNSEKYRNIYVSRFGNNLPRMPYSVLCVPNKKYDYDGSYYRSIMQMSSAPYVGAKWTCFGDSLWDYPDGYGGNDYSSELFVSKIGRELGLIIDNRANSGSNIYGNDEGSGITLLNNFITEVEEGTTEPPKYITFAFGANTNLSYVGTNDDTSEQTGTVYGATKYFIEKIREKFPSAVMGCILNPYQAWLGDTSRPDGAYNAMKEVCDEYKIPYLDMRTESGITLDMMKEGDGIHLRTVQTQTLYYHALRRFMMGL